MTVKSKSDLIRKKLKNFYNQSAEDFSRTRGNWWAGLDFIKEYIPKNGKVLDFGCGNGRLLKFIKKDSIEIKYEGVDISERLIAIAQEKYPKRNFKVIEKEDSLPFDNDDFDTVIALAVFHHFNPEMAVGALREMQRVMKRDGVLILTAWNLWNRKYLKFLLKNIFRGKFEFSAMVSFRAGDKKYWRYCYWWRPASLAKIIKKSGFKIVSSGFTSDKKNRKRNLYFVVKKQFFSEILF